MPDPRNDVVAAVDEYLRQTELPVERGPGGRFSVELPGEHKLRTSCSLRVGDHSLQVSAFVARCPDENTAAVHRWLLQRNGRLQGVAFSIDLAGDIYLLGQLPLAAVTEDTLDQIVGAVAAAADDAFDPILTLGFASSIRREWAWRLARGESTVNLGAFEHLRPPGPDTDSAAARTRYARGHDDAAGPAPSR